MQNAKGKIEKQDFICTKVTKKEISSSDFTDLISKEFSHEKTLINTKKKQNK